MVRGSSLAKSRLKKNARATKGLFCVKMAMGPIYVCSLMESGNAWGLHWYIDQIREVFLSSPPKENKGNHHKSTLQCPFIKQSIEAIYPEISPEECISSPESVGDIDLARISPRYFIRNPAACQAIRAEISPLLSSKPGDVPPLLWALGMKRINIGRKYQLH